MKLIPILGGVTLIGLITAGACSTTGEAGAESPKDINSGCRRVGDTCQGQCGSLPGRIESCRKVYSPSGSWDCRCMDNRDCFMTSANTCNSQAQCSIMGDCCKRQGNSDCACQSCRPSPKP